MARVIYLLPFLLVFSGCTNPYSQFYKDLSGGKNVLTDSRLIIPTGEPKLRQGSNPDIDTKNMCEDGYSLIGCSYFNDNDISQNAAVEQAKIVHADIVIVYKKYTHTLSGSMPITTPTYNSGTIYGSGGGMASYSGTSYTTNYVPYNVVRYDYYASYWVKLKIIRLGIYSKDLTDELRKTVGSNKGVYIIGIVKGTPAFNNDLLVGDIIRRVNGIEVIDNIQFHNWLDETHPSEIEFEIFRNGVTINKKVQVRYSDVATEAGPTEGHSQPTATDQKSKTNEVTNTGQTGESVQPQKTAPKVSVNKTPEEAPVENVGRFSSQKETCSICGKTIPKLEQHFMVAKKIICKDCCAKLQNQKPVAKN